MSRRGAGLTALVIAASACVTAPVEPRTECVLAPTSDSVCGAASGLLAYTCPAGARPDDRPRYLDGVPEGLVCADVAGVDGGAPTYCCTNRTVTCAYDPVAACAAPTFGYACDSANRPEASNPRLTCGQGLRRGALIDYCCSGMPQPAGCVQSDSVVCSTRLMGWTCHGQNLPREEELGANRSRADLYGLLCPIATPADNPTYNNYCCYTPALVPTGASCVEDTQVPACAPGRFGFACYGADTPEDDYPPMRCRDPAQAGTSAEGYAARLYCCDFAPPP